MSTSLDRARYVSLSTFRRSGAAVATPVWFAVVERSYYVFCAGNAGKVKRLRNSPRARIAACDMRGRILGPAFDTLAYLVDDHEEEARAYAALHAKYGWQMRLTDFFSRLTGRIQRRRVLRIERPGFAAAPPSSPSPRERGGQPPDRLRTPHTRALPPVVAGDMEQSRAWLGSSRGSMAILVVAVALATVACSERDGTDQPYLEFVGGGFIFNYRYAEADYGFVAKPVRRLPENSVLEAVFENPEGGAPLVLRQSTKRGRTQYVFRTPPVRGVKTGTDYHVELRLVEATTGRVIASYRRTFRSDFDQDVLPERPTVIGPGHQPASGNDG